MKQQVPAAGTRDRMSDTQAPAPRQSLPWKCPVMPPFFVRFAGPVLGVQEVQRRCEAS